MHQLCQFNLTGNCFFIKDCADCFCNLFHCLRGKTHHVLHRLTNRVVQSHHNWQRDEGQGTGAHGADAFPFIQLGNFLVHFFSVFCVALLNRRRFRLNQAHLLHTLFLLIHKGQQNELDNQGKQNQ